MSDRMEKKKEKRIISTGRRVTNLEIESTETHKNKSNTDKGKVEYFIKIS